MMGAERFRVSMSWPALAVAVALTASPALAAGVVPPKPRDLNVKCFDPVAVVLGAKPHRAPEATPGPGGGQAAAAPTDARPILTLVLERPRDCETPPGWDSVSMLSSRPGLLDGEPSDGFDTPSHAQLAAAAQGAGAGDVALAARPVSLADPVAAESSLAGGFMASGFTAGGFTGGGGFAPPPGPAHGLAARGAVGAPVPPSAGFSAFAVPQGGASPAANPSGGPSAVGDSPAGPAAPGRIAAIPEPSTWAVLVMGLFGLGASLRRRPSTLALKSV
jgi:hypothetical protein